MKTYNLVRTISTVLTGYNLRDSAKYNFFLNWQIFIEISWIFVSREILSFRKTSREKINFADAILFLWIHRVDRETHNLTLGRLCTNDIRRPTAHVHRWDAQTTGQGRCGTSFSPVSQSIAARPLGWTGAQGGQKS